MDLFNINFVYHVLRISDSLPHVFVYSVDCMAIRNKSDSYHIDVTVMAP